MKMKIPHLLMIGTILLSGCNVESDREKLAQLEQSGKIPTLDRTPTLEGIDDNQNGVRDDIEAYINKTYTQEAQKKAAMQNARSLQKTLLVDSSDIIAAKAVAREGDRAISCVSSVFDRKKDKHPAAVVTEIEAMTANTKQRLLAYLAYNKALDGTVGSLPRGDTCE